MIGKSMSLMGHPRHFGDVRATSALPPISTVERTSREVGFVPITTVLHRRNTASYSPSERYTRDADQTQLATAAFEKLERRSANKDAQTASEGLGRMSKTKDKSE